MTIRSDRDHGRSRASRTVVLGRRRDGSPAPRRSSLRSRTGRAQASRADSQGIAPAPTPPRRCARRRDPRIAQRSHTWLTRAAQPTTVMRGSRTRRAPHPPIDVSDHAVYHGRDVIRPFRRRLTHLGEHRTNTAPPDASDLSPSTRRTQALGVPAAGQAPRRDRSRHTDRSRPLPSLVGGLTGNTCCDTSEEADASVALPTRIGR
jgi:hypothetical protein